MYTPNGLMTGTEYDEKQSAGLCVKREVYYEVTSVIASENLSAAEYDKGGNESHEQSGLFDDNFGGDGLADNDVIGHVERVITDSYEECEEFGDVKTRDESDDDKQTRLDTLTEGADLSVPTEEEEYDKELEDRKYPLDEVELKRHVKENKKQQKELTLSDLGVMLGSLKKRWLGRGSLRQANYPFQNTVSVGIGERLLLPKLRNLPTKISVSSEVIQAARLALFWRVTPMTEMSGWSGP
ncbi:hypothetical protein PInf_024500 [Phytophthora infestans]|nr:hypothetical protein PInf_024500 [Phytophthora infestans]